MASLCTVANVDEDGTVQQRTLVLRDVDEELAIFVNATSPKWPHLQTRCAVMTYWPSVQVQFRLQVTTAPLPHELVAESWQLRPPMPKRMDWFYTQSHRQSSAFADRAVLQAAVQAVSLPSPLVAPGTSSGLRLVPYCVERLDLTQADGLHDRRVYTLKDNGSWEETVLVP